MSHPPPCCTLSPPGTCFQRPCTVCVDINPAVSNSLTGQLPDHRDCDRCGAVLGELAHDLGFRPVLANLPSHPAVTRTPLYVEGGSEMKIRTSAEVPPLVTVCSRRPGRPSVCGGATLLVLAGFALVWVAGCGEPEQSDGGISGSPADRTVTTVITRQPLQPPWFPTLRDIRWRGSLGDHHLTAQWPVRR